MTPHALTYLPRRSYRAEPAYILLLVLGGLHLGIAFVGLVVQLGEVWQGYKTGRIFSTPFAIPMARDLALAAVPLFFGRLFLWSAAGFPSASPMRIAAAIAVLLAYAMVLAFLTLVGLHAILFPPFGHTSWPIALAFVAGMSIPVTTLIFLALWLRKAMLRVNDCAESAA